MNDRLLARLLRTPQGAAGLVLLSLIALLALLGPGLAPRNPEAIDFLARFRPPGAQNWLGADQLGRDVLSRVMTGARATVPLAVLATLLGTVAGAVIGTLSAYLGGRWDEVFMRSIDAIMAVPGLLLALLLVNSLGKGSLNATLAIAVAFTPGMARVTRSVALSVRQQDYVKAAIARGERGSFIVLREMLPNVVGPVVVETTVRVAFAVMLFATLSFLGLGAQPPTPEWGAMLNEGRLFLRRAPQLMLYPGLMISLTVLGFNLLGDGLRDALDPRQK